MLCCCGVQEMVARGGYLYAKLDAMLDVVVVIVGNAVANRAVDVRVFCVLYIAFHTRVAFNTVWHCRLSSCAIIPSRYKDICTYAQFIDTLNYSKVEAGALCGCDATPLYLHFNRGVNDSTLASCCMRNKLVD